ncbi:MAG TPA: endonuclease/exonuclease/phosphatase family protein [Hyphomonadaceae bacterium]|nr:endonuclease/exonuclease/phosphatase family protein [Hyphomonadaceae bacterium]
MNRWRIAGWVLAVAVAAATIMGLADRIGLGKIGWVFDLLSHFPKHLFVLAMIAAIVAGIGRTWRGGLLALGVAGVNALLVLTLGGYALPQAAPPNSTPIRVVSANLHGSAAALSDLIKLSAKYDADLIALYEAPEDMTLEDAARLFPEMRTVKIASQTPEGRKLIRRSVLMAKSPNADGVTLTTFPESYGVIMRTHLPVAGSTVRIATVHPPSPVDPDAMGDRNQELLQVGEGIPDAAPFIILGDFNATPWGRSYGFVPGIRAGDPRFDGSFPALAGPVGLPIDHIKFGGGLVLTEYHVGPDIGSDHRPLFATFALPEPLVPPAPVNAAPPASLPSGVDPAVPPRD